MHEDEDCLNQNEEEEKEEEDEAGVRAEVVAL